MKDAAAWTIDRLAGQRLMLGFDGTAWNRDLQDLLDDLTPGGVILFARNLGTPDDIRSLCANIQDHAASRGLPPLFIAIDQEGGQVARLRAPFTEFPGNPAMQGVGDAEAFARTTAEELRGIGVNMNMAPVMDVAFDPGSVMAGRSFGGDPAWVSRLGVAVIETLQAGGVMAVAKHFPGIGRTVLDSHLDLPELDADSDALTATDLLPFEAAIHSRAAGVMLSHILYTSLDAELPASLSAAIARDLLRRRMGYDGLVITDDLDMGAVAKHFDMETMIHRIIRADVDIALICHRSPKMEVAFESFKKRLRDDPDVRRRGEESVGRILGVKGEYLPIKA